MPDKQAQPRILIVRLGAMGDIMHALPAVTALRVAHPDWYLGWAIEPRWHALLCADSKAGDCGRDPLSMPLVDRIHRVNAKQWGQQLFRASTVSAIMAIRSELRAQRYDVALDLQGAIRSAIFALWSHAPRRIGEANPREYPARFLFNERIATHAAHVIDQDCEVASAIVNESLSAVLPWMPVDRDAETWCDRFLASVADRRHTTGRVVLMNPGAGWGAKRWPVERYGQVAAMLHELGYVVLINSGPDERLLATTLIEASGHTAVSVACELSTLIAITRRASLMIAGDTGPLHLASALGKPVIGIFGPTDPARNGPYGFNGSEHLRCRVFRSPESRRDHTRRMEPEAGLLTITPEAVMEAAVDLLHESGTQ